MSESSLAARATRCASNKSSSTEHICRGEERRTFEGRVLSDETIRRAFVRSLEVIGEATKNLPPEFREEHDHVDASAIAGMRDKLRHGYFGVDYDIVWDVVLNELLNYDASSRSW